MSNPYFSGETLDDVMRWVFQRILNDGLDICPTKGRAKEITGVFVEITNPLARISRTETKGKPFSCLGELCWYLAKNNDLSFIRYYLRHYETVQGSNSVYSAYGPRLFNWKNANQFSDVLETLKRKPDSRQAVIQLFDARDVKDSGGDVPCTCTLQFMIRNNRLQMITHMRSNDAYIGMPHDVFCFTMLQEILARTLGVQLGTYKHVVGSLHIYDKNATSVQEFLGEGWQKTQAMMSPMPNGDPWSAIQDVLSAESVIREGEQLDTSCLSALDPYWADLIRLLLIFRHSKDRETDKIRRIRDEMSSNSFDFFIDRRITRSQQNA